MALLLELLIFLELKPLPDAPIEAQLIGVLKAHKKSIGWNISEMMDNDIEIFMIDISVVGTTFKDYLQNLSTMLK